MMPTNLFMLVKVNFNNAFVHFYAGNLYMFCKYLNTSQNQKILNLEEVWNIDIDIFNSNLS